MPSAQTARLDEAGAGGTGVVPGDVDDHVTTAVRPHLEPTHGAHRRDLHDRGRSAGLVGTVDVEVRSLRWSGSVERIAREVSPRERSRGGQVDHDRGRLRRHDTRDVDDDRFAWQQHRGRTGVDHTNRARQRDEASTSGHAGRCRNVDTGEIDHEVAHVEGVELDGTVGTQLDRHQVGCDLVVDGGVEVRRLRNARTRRVDAHEVVPRPVDHGDREHGCSGARRYARHADDVDPDPAIGQAHERVDRRVAGVGDPALGRQRQEHAGPGRCRHDVRGARSAGGEPRTGTTEPAPARNWRRSTRARRCSGFSAASSDQQCRRTRVSCRCGGGRPRTPPVPPRPTR